MMGYGWGGWGNMMGPGGFGLLGWIPMLFFWLILILGFVALVDYLSKSGQVKENKSARDILEERYAKGEINKEKFEEMKKDLS